MRRAAFIFGIALVAAAAGAAAAHQVARPPATALKTLHLFNIPPADEPKLLAALADLNEAIAEAGYPQAGYRVWKVSGTQQGSHQYIWEGNWPDRNAYLAIHANDAYQRASKRTRAAQDLTKDHVYNHYLEVPLGPRPRTK